ncbi:MAG: hypothetical protein NDI94_02995 [Candidatus Woesearchaeota archaeon]|nr:hypothetical protein [Candidatus Woesearchaeota archaeon]
MTLAAAASFMVYENAMEMLGIIKEENYNPITHGYSFTAPSRVGSLVSRLSLNFGGMVGKQVLEIACGGGNVADRFAEEGAVAYGFDYNKKLIKLADMLADELIGHNIIDPSNKPAFFQGRYVRAISYQRDAKSQEYCMPYQTYLLSMDTLARFHSLGTSPHDMDFWYVYPWPGEVGNMMRMFRYYAKKDAVLALYKEDRRGQQILKFFDGLENHSISDREFEIWVKK